VPIVAAMQGMYSLEHYPIDHPLWIFLSYTAGTGGSILVIGSAAGVGVMGLRDSIHDKGIITFWWFVKKISIWAFIGYCAGAIAYLLLKAYVY
jgi:Na+/H+ antiporter NhaD/arsenite permease-like protein